MPSKITVAFDVPVLRLVTVALQNGVPVAKGKRMREVIEARVEVERELQVRTHVYPRLVEQGKLTQGEATRRMKALRYVLYLLDSAQQDMPIHTPTTGE